MSQTTFSHLIVARPKKIMQSLWENGGSSIYPRSLKTVLLWGRGSILTSKFSKVLLKNLKATGIRRRTACRMWSSKILNLAFVTVGSSGWVRVIIVNSFNLIEFNFIKFLCIFICPRHFLGVVAGHWFLSPAFKTAVKQLSNQVALEAFLVWIS